MHSRFVVPMLAISLAFTVSFASEKPATEATKTTKSEMKETKGCCAKDASAEAKSHCATDSEGVGAEKTSMTKKEGKGSCCEGHEAKGMKSKKGAKSGEAKAAPGEAR